MHIKTTKISLVLGKRWNKICREIKVLIKTESTELTTLHLNFSVYLQYLWLINNNTAWPMCFIKYYNEVNRKILF